MSTPTTTYACPCGAALAPADLVRALTSYDPGSRLFGGACPSCHAGIELQLARAHIDWGYTYWAGSMHFEAMGRVKAPGLSLSELPEREALEVRLGDWSKLFPIPPTTGYLNVRKGDHAVGRTLDALDLESLGVEVRGMQAPGYVAMALDRRAPLQPNMRVEIFGPLSARRRAETRVTEGP